MTEEATLLSADPRRRRVRWIWVPVVIVLLFAAVAGVFFFRSDGYFSDPNAARDSKTYEELLGPPRAAPAVEATALSSITITQSGNSLTVQYPAAMSNPVGLPGYTIQRVPFGEVAEFGNASVELKHLAVAQGEFPSNRLSEWSIDLPGKFYNNRLEPLSEEERDQRFESWETKLKFQGKFPGVKFVLEHGAGQRMKFLGFALFDATTRFSLGSGYSWSGDSRRMYVQTACRRWHPGPVELIADVAHGPVEQREISPVAGSSVQFDSWEVHLLAAIPGETISSSTSSGYGGTNTIRLGLAPLPPGASSSHSSFIFAVFPTASSMPIEIDFLDAEDKKLSGGGSSTSGAHLIAECSQPLQKVARIRVTFYPQTERLVFMIPRLPGLPEENKAVKNLFDVRIPYARVNSTWDLEELIRGTVQMEFSAASMNPPAGYFPREFRNVTPRQLLDEYLAHTRPGFGAEVDPTANQIRIKVTFLRELLKKIEIRLRSWL